MNRRQFLAVTSAGLAAGCGRPPAGPVVGPDELRLIQESQAARRAHLAMLDGFRVPADAARTTPKPPADVLSAAPELKGLLKIAVRLHPRFGAEPGADESKVGGLVLWPAGDPWPTCPDHAAPLAPVVQLRAEDGPPGVLFRPGTDLLQVLWCPRDHGAGLPRPEVVWRKRAAVRDPLAEVPAADPAVADFVPVPCRVFPERVVEFPGLDVLPKPARDKVAGLPGGAGAYADLLSTAPGTKVGGWPRSAGPAAVPTCPRCRWGMDHLLTVAGDEWDAATRPRWRPAEESDAGDADGFRRAAGLLFGARGAARVFVCRRCDGWPAGVG